MDWDIGAMSHGNSMAATSKKQDKNNSNMAQGNNMKNKGTCVRSRVAKEMFKSLPTLVAQRVHPAMRWKKFQWNHLPLLAVLLQRLCPPEV
jgi:hypothetical protein